MPAERTDTSLSAMTGMSASAVQSPCSTRSCGIGVSFVAAVGGTHDEERRHLSRHRHQSSALRFSKESSPLLHQSNQGRGSYSYSTYPRRSGRCVWKFGSMKGPSHARKLPTVAGLHLNTDRHWKYQPCRQSSAADGAQSSLRSPPKWGAHSCRQGSFAKGSGSSQPASS